LEYLQREPVEFELQLDMQARRDFQKAARQQYRQAMESMGQCMRYEPPWPPKQPPEVDDEGPHEKRPPRLKYRMSPFPESVDMEARAAQRRRQVIRENEIEGPRRKAAMAKIQTLSANSSGAPYTLKQVYHEVEARVQHRDATDTRAVTGTLGPLELGVGTTRSRRQLSFPPHRKYLNWDARKASAKRPDVSVAIALEAPEIN